MQKINPFSQYSPHGDFEGYPFDEKEVVKLCPKEFKKEDNPWSVYANKIIESGQIDSQGWQWKTKNKEERDKQLFLLDKWLGIFLPCKERIAVAGWMLSEMLSKVPT